MNLDFFLKFSRFRIASLGGAEDFADKFNFQLTSALILLFVAVVGVRQYIFSPIQCWIPKEFDKAWEEYAENYCWVSDTYFHQVEGGPPDEISQRSKQRIGYYQWVPFVLGLQALLFYTPHLAWKLLSVRSGTSVRQVVRYAADANTLDQDKRSKMISFLARQLEKMSIAKRCREGRRPPPGGQGCWRALCSPCRCYNVFGRQSGAALLATYLLVKLLYLANALGQLLMMRVFLGFDSTTFGADILIGLAGGRTWNHSGLFPRVTWCDFVVRRVGNPQRYSVQCVLPINMLNEKIYIFLWFWVTAAAFIMGLSIVRWIVSMVALGRRRRYVKHYLRLLSPLARGGPDWEEDRRLLHRFVAQFLRYDGVLTLRMIGHAAGDLMVAELLAELWRLWRDRHFPTTPPTDDAAPPKAVVDVFALQPTAPPPLPPHTRIKVNATTPQRPPRSATPPRSVVKQRRQRGGVAGPPETDRREEVEESQPIPV